MVLSTHKKVTSVLALGLTAALLFGSTFAWQSLNQEALNYVKGGANPGGRLHDDFNNVTDEISADVKTYNKDVYVENFTSAANDGVNIYARIRLEEFMAFGTNASHDSKETDAGITMILSKAIFKPNETGSPFRTYWTLSWDKGGSTVYMPTFNKNKDSLIADINGTSDQDFADYKSYRLGDIEAGYVIQDKDDNDDDELKDEAKVKDLIEKGPDSTYYASSEDHIRVSSQKIDHTAASTLTASACMSISDWLTATGNGANYTTTTEYNHCWVYDTDGWFYWTAPIAPGTATGLLLDQIQRTETPIDGDWYYELNVVAQFITADDLGSKEEKTGFYNDEKGAAPSDSALTLLKTIGVDVDGSGAAPLALLDAETDRTPVSDEYELRAALEQDGDVILMDDIALTSTVFIEDSAFVYLNGCDITAASDFSGQALFTVDGRNACLDFDGRGTVQAPADGCAVQVSGGGLLYIWDGTFVGGTDVFYAENGDVVIVDGTFYLRDDDAGQVLSWSSGSEIIIYGGEFYHFDPSNANGTSLLGDGYTVEVESYGGNTVYTVVVDAEDEWPELPVEQPEDVLPGDEPEADQPETGMEMTGPVESGPPEEGTDSAPAGDDSVSGETVETEGEPPADTASDAAPTPDSSVVESTGTGAVSGISGKAETVEPAAPDAGGAADGPQDSGEDTATPVEE